MGSMVIKQYDMPKAREHPRFKFAERRGLDAKLAAHAANGGLAGGPCPDTTKAGNPCKGSATETGYCVGHSKTRGLL